MCCSCASLNVRSVVMFSPCLRICADFFVHRVFSCLDVSQVCLPRNLYILWIHHRTVQCAMVTFKNVILLIVTTMLIYNYVHYWIFLIVAFAMNDKSINKNII